MTATTAPQRTVIEKALSTSRRSDAERAALMVEPGFGRVHTDPQPDPFGQHPGGQQPAVRHQVRLIEALRHRRQHMRCFHRADAP